MYRGLVLSILLVLTTLRVSASIDSIGVENINGKKNIVHKIEAKETYFSLGRKYNVSPQTIIQYNNNKSLQIGAIVKIPTDRPFVESTLTNNSNQTETNQSNTSNPIEYKVGPKEYLYSIARKFNTTVEEIKALNNLSSNNLAIGQILKIPNGSTVIEPVVAPTAPVVNPRETNPVTSTSNMPAILTDSIKNASERLKLPVQRYGLREVNEKGVAVTLVDESLSDSKMLALHQTAPIGTVIKITYPMTGKSTFARVVGKFTQNEMTKDAIIVVNKATANLIGALDNRFQVTLIYGVPNE